MFFSNHDTALFVFCRSQIIITMDKYFLQAKVELMCYVLINFV